MPSYFFKPRKEWKQKLTLYNDAKCYIKKEKMAGAIHSNHKDKIVQSSSITKLCPNIQNQPNQRFHPSATSRSAALRSFPSPHTSEIWDECRQRRP